MSLSSYIFLACLGYVAYVSNPSEASFKAFLSTPEDKDKERRPRTAAGSVKNFFSKILAPLLSSSSTQLPTFRRHDYVLFCVVYLDAPDSPSYLGIFGSWFLLPSSSPSSSSTANASLPLGQIVIGASNTAAGNEFDDSAADAMRKQAIRCKIEKQYAASGDCFLQAAQMYAATTNYYASAAESYEDAFKVWKQAGDTYMPQAMMALEKCAAMHLAQNRLSRAASVFEKLAQLHENLVPPGNEGASVMAGIPGSFDGSNDHLKNALKFWNEAARLYLIEDDSRAIQASLRWADLAASAQLYKESQREFHAAAKASFVHPHLRFRAHQYLLSAVFCAIASLDWVHVGRLIGEYIDEFPGFESSREHHYLQELLDAVSSQDVESLVAIAQSRDGQVHLKSWEIKVLLRAKNSLENESLM